MLIPRGLIKAKATSYVKTDVKGRRHRELTGLGTPVVFAGAHRRALIIVPNIIGIMIMFTSCYQLAKGEVKISQIS